MNDFLCFNCGSCGNYGVASIYPINGKMVCTDCSNEKKGFGRVFPVNVEMLKILKEKCESKQLELFND